MPIGKKLLSAVALCAIALVLLGWLGTGSVLEINRTLLGSTEAPSFSATAINMVVMPFLGYGVTDSAILMREEEYKLCLRKNLAHPSVQHVHLLTTNSTDSQVRFKEFTSNSKLVIYEAKNLTKTQDVFEYVSRHLLGKDVMIVNADIYLGDGFNRIDATVMDQQNIMYAISRYSAPRRHGVKYDEDMCSKYIGSHDAFLFRLHRPLTEEFLQLMDFPYPNAGMEGRMIWAFKNVLKYCVLNPCSILKTFHYHYSHLRSHGSRPRLNATEHYSVQYPSKSLYCLNSSFVHDLGQA
jgi:hypothetical protein